MALALVSRPVGRPVRSNPLDIRASKTFHYLALGLWRKDPIKTEVFWRYNGNLYCRRYHPHKNCSGFFMLTGEQVEVLLEFHQAAPWHRVVLPYKSKGGCYADTLPDGGLQLVRLDPRGVMGSTFRIFAQDVAAFLGFAERWLPRL